MITREQALKVYKETGWYGETGRRLGVSRQYIWAIINRYKPNSYKQSARKKLQRAIKSNKINRPIRCENCNKKVFLHGHHPDYSKPLKVMWLCIKCHIKAHNFLY